MQQFYGVVISWRIALIPVLLGMGVVGVAYVHRFNMPWFWSTLVNAFYIVVAQFIAVCRRSKWSKHVTNSPSWLYWP